MRVADFGVDVTICTAGSPSGPSGKTVVCNGGADLEMAAGVIGVGEGGGSEGGMELPFETGYTCALLISVVP